jgi:hypothetical protein
MKLYKEMGGKLEKKRKEISPKRKGLIFVSAKSISTYIIVMAFENSLFICSSIDYRFTSLSTSTYMYIEIRDKPSFYIEDI